MRKRFIICTLLLAVSVKLKVFSQPINPSKPTALFNFGVVAPFNGTKNHDIRMPKYKVNHLGFNMGLGVFGQIRKLRIGTMITTTFMGGKLDSGVGNINFQTTNMIFSIVKKMKSNTTISMDIGTTYRQIEVLKTDNFNFSNIVTGYAYYGTGLLQVNYRHVLTEKLDLKYNLGYYVTLHCDSYLKKSQFIRRGTFTYMEAGLFFAL